MNTLTKSGVIALFAFAPAMAMAVDTDDIQNCMNSFAQTHFANSTVKFVAEAPNLVLPLEFNRGTHEIQVTATNPNTGDVLASGVCTVSDSSRKSGTVSITTDTTK